MKKLFKPGFTLAEVLITIAVIGVVAAITMPTMISSYQYKAIGTKLSKFAANLESNARAYAAANATLTTVNASDFVAESFLFATGDTNGTLAKSTVAMIKDGTFVKYADAASSDHNTTKYPVATYGQPIIKFTFSPGISGLPASAQKQYDFVVTELGYTFPATTDTCLTDIYNKQWITKKNDYKSGTNCYKTSGQSDLKVSGT